MMDELSTKLGASVMSALHAEAERMLVYGSPASPFARGILDKDRSRRVARTEIARQVAPKMVPASNRARVGDVEVERNSYVTPEQARRFLDMGPIDPEQWKW